MSGSSNGIQIYWRQFLREGSSPFQDFPADDAFANLHFVDFFGKVWLKSHPNALSLDDVLRYFYDSSLQPDSSTFIQIFAVADGSVVESTEENKSWLRQSIRFVALVAGNDTKKKPHPFDSNSWTLCVVGSGRPKDTELFLQVASWDGTRFRYYGREHPNGDPDQPSAWIYQGDSLDAFGDQSYLGPFNGHVNGSLVMKELRQPWIHWLAPGTGFTNNVSNAILDQYDEFPYLSDGTSHNLSKVEGANTMEGYITSGVTKWLSSRRQMDFVDEKGSPRVEVKNVKRWMAHVLLTTTVNVISALPDTSQGHTNSFFFPTTQFYNADVFGKSASSGIQPANFNPLAFGSDPYGVAVNALGLALVQVYPDPSLPQPDPKLHPDAGAVTISGENVEMFVVEFGESQNFQYTILQPSFEDVQGTLTLLTMKTPLLSKNCLYSLLMVDPWNPVYSWKRGVLMQYIPDTTRLPGPFDASANPPQKYDLEAVLEEAVRSSPRFKNDPSSPEREFIANLEAQRNGTAKFSDRMTEYLNNVGRRLNDPSTVNTAMTDYMTLAESRRRIYRPVPLDEFDLTLPWATKYKHDSPLEMRSDGTIGPIADRGKKFLKEWIGSLSSQNPQLIPRPDKDDTSDKAATMLHSNLLALATRTAGIGCQSSPSIHSIRRSGCPALSARQRSLRTVL